MSTIIAQPNKKLILNLISLALCTNKIIQYNFEKLSKDLQDAQ